MLILICVIFGHVRINCRKPLLGSSCLYVRVEKLGSHLTDFRYASYLSILGETLQETSSFIKIWQDILHEDRCTFIMKYLTEFFLESDTFQTQDAEKYWETFYIPYISSKNPALYEKMWKNIVELDGLQMT